jgi:hypothetical protein
MEDKKIIGCLGILVSVIGVIVISSIMYGWAISILWRWFVVPLFDAPNLSILEAIGLSLTIGVFTTRYRDTPNSKSNTIADITASIIAYSIINPVVIVIIGYVVKGLSE